MLIVGWVFVILGVVGLFLPILQGILFLLVGLGILSKYSQTAHRIAERLRARFPSLDARAQALADWWHRRVTWGRRRRSDESSSRNDVARETSQS
jgi:uncharacterized membrane protein YbaN (DUF454 family)